MKHQKSIRPSDYHCTVLEQKRLVAEMTRCDQVTRNHEDRYECYLNASVESRENKACMYS